MKALIGHISTLIEERILGYHPISGGDISNAFLLKTSINNYFLKVNSSNIAHKMFFAEKNGLLAIAKTNTVKTPNIFNCDEFKGFSFLLMEHINRKSPSDKDFNLLGSQLAQLHLISNNNFGFDSNNFIGNLDQSNSMHSNWNDFYVEERLIPQFKLVRSNGLLKGSEIPETKKMKDICFPYFCNVKPSLLHGDLWSGNFLISTNGTPYLIDPAVYFGHHEVDIAMSKLFGGFGQSFYDAYHNIIPKDEFTEDRIQLYQLYYLLVHLNLFGPSYHSSVKKILTKYF